MTESSPPVRLKFNQSSVMLYRIERVRLPDGKPARREGYVSSFSFNVTELPEEFERQLRDLTRDDPARYRELVVRIEERALKPARERARLKAAERERARLLSNLEHAAETFEEAVRRLFRAAPSPELEERREAMERAARSLLPNGLQNVRNTTAGSAEAQATELASQSNADELFAALRDVNLANARAQKVVRELGSRIKVSSPAILEWQRAWYSYQDLLNAGKNRTSLRRPSGWSDAGKREQVLGGRPLGLE